ncbi:MAG: hypothetical protein OEN02_01035 [Gammaproteobacteria bacterium]|nr:hypothetical protein [Gammaproteobacteria bacterium]MDH3537259.1 hypothetical protein [Gammaproteobacteria bacterium]
MMRITFSILIATLLFLQPGVAEAMDANALWGNRCEQCHGEAGEFSGKYLWVIDDKLQGQHHVENLRLFLRNHYIPGHGIEALYDLLRAQANTPARFGNECSGCHESATTFVRKSIFTRAGELTGAASGVPVETFLATHRDLTKEDVEFFTKLLLRMSIVVYGQ